jgi:ABC-type Co2+ transport system permease subunit
VLSTFAHWAIVALVAGVVAAAVLLAAGAAGVWWLRRWIRRRLADFIGKAAGYAGRAAATNLVYRWDPPQPVAVRGAPAAGRAEPELTKWPGE